MIDRYGAPIRIGWHEHEVMWIKAALTLEGHQRTFAFWDIAEMTGRSLESVRSKAYEILKAREPADHARRVMVLGAKPGPRPLPDSEIAPITLARRMAGRA